MIQALCQQIWVVFLRPAQNAVYQKLKPNCLLQGSEWMSCTMSVSGQCKTSFLQLSITANTEQQILLPQTSVMCPLIAFPHRLNKHGAFNFSAFFLWSMTKFQWIVCQRPTYQSRNRIFTTGIPLQWLSLSLYLLLMKNTIISNNNNTVIITGLIMMIITIERAVTTTKNCSK